MCVFVVTSSLILLVDENSCCGSLVEAVVVSFKCPLVDDSVGVIVFVDVAVVVFLFLQLSSEGSQSIFRL